MRRLAKFTFLPTIAVLVAAYSATWAFGRPSARAHLVRQGEAWLLPTLPPTQPADAAERRADFLRYATGSGMRVESRGQLDFAFDRQIPLFPGVLVSRFVPCYDGLCMPEASVTSIVVWYGFGSWSIGAITAQGWHWGSRLANYGVQLTVGAPSVRAWLPIRRLRAACS